MSTAKPVAAKKTAQLRTIAPLPFRGGLSTKAVDAAIKAVMAQRSAAVQMAVRAWVAPAGLEPVVVSQRKSAPPADARSAVKPGKRQAHPVSAPTGRTAR